jgi:hypothetical protein
MNKDDILARELGKLGAVSAGASGLVVGGGVMGAAAAAGGASGAWLAAKFLPTETHAREYLMPRDAGAALKMAADVLAGLGQLQDSSGIDSPCPVLMAVVGSGFMKLNPCVLTVELSPRSGNETAAVIRGAAKEGLIKQRTAEKAVARVIDALDAAMKIS